MDDQTRQRFTHLRVHSHFSFYRATPSLESLVERATTAVFPALALTDDHLLTGAVAFAKVCHKAGLAPILGLTVKVQTPTEDLQNLGPGELTLLATSTAGYRTLCRLSSHLQSDANRVWLQTHGLGWETLKAHREGVICLDGGRHGWLERYLRAGDRAAASRYVSRLGGLFGEDAAVSLELHQPADAPIVREVAQMGSRFGLPAVVAHPVRTLHPSETRDLLPLLAAIEQNGRLADQPPIDPNLTYHWQTPEEISERYAEFPEAIRHVGDIIDRCGDVLPDGQPIWPILPLPKKQTPKEALEEQSKAGLLNRYTNGLTDLHHARLQHELTLINQHGFAPLFLLVADITRYAREQEIPYNTRGSVANSLVAYALGITTVDPLLHDLLFERFLNPARTSLPDIDLDFCSRRRDEILHYVRDTYGDDRVALVATVNTLQPKSAVRAVGKAHGLPEKTLKRLSNLVPSHWHPDPRRRGENALPNILRQLESDDEKAAMKRAFDLVDFPSHLSIHPGGVVITPTPLTDVVPLQLAPKGFLITQFAHQDLETIGLPKLDLLGIRALTVLTDAAELIRAHHDSDFRLADIPAEDEQTAVLLQQGDTIGVFQCESTGAQRTLRQLRVRNVADLAVANAFFKPGPATGGMAANFIRRYRGEERVSYLHPALEPILSKTKGVLLFQEQIMRLAVEIAGLSWTQANVLRRGMSKFKAKEMAALQLDFTRGCKGNGLSDEQCETLWQQVMAFAGYGFNQGHATAYADVSYRSAFLRAHYPAAFLTARLLGSGGFHHPTIYLAEATRLGVQVQPPHVNQSRRKYRLTFAGDRPTLWLGLGQVRDLRRASVQAIVANAPFASLRDLLSRVSLQGKEVTHLIQCGALDGLGDSRAAMLAAAEGMLRAGSAMQLSFGFSEQTAVRPETTAQRIEWELKLLGQPVSVHPLELVHEQIKDDVPLRYLPRLRNQATTITAVRLPGWTGGSGSYFGDGETFVVGKWERSVPKSKRKPTLWQPVRLRGHWREDEWGNGWFAADAVHPLAP